MRLFNRFDFDFDLDSIETYVSARLRAFLAAAVALLVFVTLVAVTVFFLAVRGAEQTLVPDIKGKELTAALLELQVKELYPRIQLRYSESSAEKGTVLEQDPAPGAIVKAGRRIKLVVSRGIVVDRIEDFVGQNLDDVKMHIQTLFSTSSRPLLSVREPPAYRFSSEAAGTILEQKPEAGVEVSGPMKLDFVVSRGPENAMVKVPDLIGLPVADALERIRQSGIFFSIQVRSAQGNEVGDTVVSQLPAGEEVVAANTRVALVVSAPTKLEEGELFGLFSRTLPDYPYPLSVKLEALLPSNERRRIFASDFPGGDFSVPFRLPEGSTLILSVLNREILREDAVAYATGK